MKFIPVLLLLILTSCAYTVVRVKHPVPDNRRDLSGFHSDLIGEYDVTDTIIDEVFFDGVNEMYEPEIILAADTSVFITARMTVVVSEHAIISKTILTGYMFRSFYDAEVSKRPDEIDTIIFLNDTVKLVSKEEIDTLFNNQTQDLLRKYKGHYLLNRWYDDSYSFILLTKTQRGSLKLLDLDEDRLVDYYNSFDHENSEAKADLVYSEEPITLKNSDLKNLIRKDYFTLRQSLSKKAN